MPTNINDPDEIIRAVGRQEEQTLSLRDRMEGDYRLYRLEPYQEVDGYGQPVEGFRSYTSNAPQVYADKGHPVDCAGGVRRPHPAGGQDAGAAGGRRSEGDSGRGV